MAATDVRQNQKRRHRLAEFTKQLLYLRRRSDRGPLTPNQKSRLEMLEIRVRDLRARNIAK
jgi:hypothetical protein